MVGDFEMISLYSGVETQAKYGWLLNPTFVSVIILLCLMIQLFLKTCSFMVSSHVLVLLFRCYKLTTLETVHSKEKNGQGVMLETSDVHPKLVCMADFLKEWIWTFIKIQNSYLSLIRPRDQRFLWLQMTSSGGGYEGNKQEVVLLKGCGAWWCVIGVYEWQVVWAANYMSSSLMNCFWHGF